MGKFHDLNRKDGYMISFTKPVGFLTLAVRPSIRFAFVNLGWKWRLYVGPFEIESYYNQEPSDADL